MLIWNQRLTDESAPFMYAYHQLLRRVAIDYDITRHTRFDPLVLHAFFAPNVLKVKTFTNSQHFDFEGMKGRALSSSYTPSPSHPTYQAMIEALQMLFDTYQVNGQVTFKYETKVYYGHLT